MKAVGEGGGDGYGGKVRKVMEAVGYTMGAIPIAFAAALLLGLGWTVAGVPGFAKVAWEMLLWASSAIGKANMVTVGGLVSASHCGIVSILLT